MFCQFLVPKALFWPTQERDGKHMNSRMRLRERKKEKERGRTPSGLKCVIEWAGMGMKKHWL